VEGKKSLDFFKAAAGTCASRRANNCTLGRAIFKGSATGNESAWGYFKVWKHLHISMHMFAKSGIFIVAGTSRRAFFVASIKRTRDSSGTLHVSCGICTA